MCLAIFIFICLCVIACASEDKKAIEVTGIVTCLIVLFMLGVGFQQEREYYEKEEAKEEAYINNLETMPVEDLAKELERRFKKGNE